MSEEKHEQDMLKQQELATAKKDIEDEDGEDDDEGEDETVTPAGEAQQPTAGAAKKKKNKKKKKKPAGAVAAGAAASTQDGGAAKPTGMVYNRISTLPEEEFVAYCSKVLKESEPKDLPSPEERLKLPAKFENYRFTGETRPTYVSKRVQCPPHIKTPDYAVSGRSPSEEQADRKGEIPVYNAQEIAKLRHVCAIGREVLDVAGRFVRAGVTGDEIDRLVHHVCMEWNAYPSPLNYYNFPKSVCVSVNEIICHGIPDFRPLQNGDIVNIDVSVYVDGYHTDLNEMFMIGEVDEESKRLVKTSYLALQAAAKMIKPGTFYRDVGNEITKIATKGGCAVVKKYSGHGVGKLFHCLPTIPHYAHNKGVGIMRPGHVFTIEPMLNLGTNWGDVLWPDNWTAATRDGKRSAQFEHTFLVTDTGCEILTARPGASRTEMVWDEDLERRLTRPGSSSVVASTTAPEAAPQ